MGPSVQVQPQPRGDNCGVWKPGRGRLLACQKLVGNMVWREWLLQDQAWDRTLRSWLTSPLPIVLLENSTKLLFDNTNQNQNIDNTNQNQDINNTNQIQDIDNTNQNQKHLFGNDKLKHNSTVQPNIRHI